MPLEVQVAVSKVKKYAVSESGDTVELIERPYGGLSVVLADGQRSGRAAKMVSNIAVRKTISLLAEGVRDGAAARAAHDYLRLQRAGKVSADLIILSLDLHTRTLVISRNTRCPVLLLLGDESIVLDDPSDPIGIHPATRPVIREYPLTSHTTVLAFSDGLLDAGSREGRRVPYMELLERFHREDGRVAQHLTDSILKAALALDRERPVDDTTILAITVYTVAKNDGIRRMNVRFPIPTILPPTGV